MATGKDRAEKAVRIEFIRDEEKDRQVYLIGQLKSVIIIENHLVNYCIALT
ncbi:hypothetical protein GCM10009092_28400 [Bowmanella denitrificans]|uniref:Uncharacterized protein n=1 Tax=Bowmanella denitrificans TaxID=366582 RepID=A0ABP3H6Y0_9ALTE